MILTVVRDDFQAGCTRGRLYCNGVFECFTLEDVVRTGPKVPGRTAIPTGAYPLIVSVSPRFQRKLPLLIGVPNFTGIRIHAGNTANETEGCILVGLRLGAEDQVEHSLAALDRLVDKLGTAQHTIIVLNHAPNPR